MPFRKKKPTVRKTLETTAAGLATTVAVKAPQVRDQVVTKLHEGADEARNRWPDIRDELVDRRDQLVERLPDDVSDRLPEAAKPKKKKSKLRKIALIGLVAALGGVAYSRVKNAGNSSLAPYTPPATRPAPDLTKSSEPTPMPDSVRDLADDSAPDTVK